VGGVTFRSPSGSPRRKGKRLDAVALRLAAQYDEGGGAGVPSLRSLREISGTGAGVAASGPKPRSSFKGAFRRADAAVMRHVLTGPATGAALLLASPQ
jgi:hypothetical protein